MTPKMRADIWTVHLLRIMREHPELTADQRSLIYEGLGLIAGGIFEIDRTSQEWTTKGRPTLLDLTKRVFASFPPEIARALMTDPRDSLMTAPAPADRFRIRTQSWMCVCSVYLQTDCGAGSAAANSPSARRTTVAGRGSPTRATARVADPAFASLARRAKGRVQRLI